jgi:hypothetical protein
MLAVIAIGATLLLTSGCDKMPVQVTWPVTVKNPVMSVAPKRTMWEYHTHVIYPNLPENIREKDEDWNEFGKYGWELATSFVPPQKNDQVVLIFKRPVD